MASTRFPNAELIALVAEICDKTQADVQAVINALPEAMIAVYTKKGNQEIEIGGLGVFEERQVKGKTPKELGSISYNVPAVSFRASSVFKNALKGKAVKLLDDGKEELLTDEEYEAIIANLEVAA